MRILVLYRLSCEKLRKTIDDHLFSFKRYVEDVDFFYCDVIHHLPCFVFWIEWDAVIFHYTVLSERFDQGLWQILSKQLGKAKRLKGFKVALPQDEYAHTSQLWTLFRKISIDTVFTCAQPIDYDKLYPLEKTGLRHRFSTLTGFVDENTLSLLTRLSQEIQERDIDAGYRARDLPFWLGRHARIKKELADAALKTPNHHNLKLDISTKNNDVLYGDDWLKFLLRCRTTLGCLGGASLYDPDGIFRKQVDQYLQEQPLASFEEVERTCFPGSDYSLNLFALSPRHFECAMAKTCQVLVEGDYQGILKPGVHFIELKKDFSNYAEVFDKIADRTYCEAIAENAYQDVVVSGKYTYRAFANQVVDHIRQNSLQKPLRKSLKAEAVRGLLRFHTRWWVPRMYLFQAWNYLKNLVKK